MDNKKLMSGHELVDKGITKIEVKLPEIGLKDIFPNGSWLEQKQIQAAVEARKHLIDVERIEKSGTLSHAIWREELTLAEVTQKVGSYWQYLGHNKGKQLFLKPEETLFLMEINCLHLKYNDVKVSLQQAYSLLLRDKITILQYKVYASLSRLGYRVYRFEDSESSTCEQKINIPSSEKINNNNTLENNEVGEIKDKPILIHEYSETNDESRKESSISNDEIRNCSQDSIITEDKCESKNNIIDEIHNEKQSLNRQTQATNQIKNKDLYAIKKLQKLKNRVLKPCNAKNIQRFFENFPELTDKGIVSVQAPQKQYIPNSINLSTPIFEINLQNIQSKNVTSDSTDTNIYTINDEVNGSHIRRLINTSNRSDNIWIPPFPNIAFPNQNMQFRQFNFWRPRQNYNTISFNMLFQRHFLPSLFFTPRFQLPRMQTQFWQTNLNNSNRNIDINNKKRTIRIAKKQHLEEIKKLASKLKQLILRGSAEEENIQSLQRLIQTYNTKYKTRIRLSDDFNVVVEEVIVDTINLDEDGEPSKKKRRRNNDDHKIDDNLKALKHLASQLKELEQKNKLSARHRRAFSKLLRTFNESYNEEYTLGEDYEIENRQQIILDTLESSNLASSREVPKFSRGKKLRNPFNILKRLSEKQKEICAEASTSKENNISEIENKKYSELLLKTFTKDWLPPEDDFGRAEIVTQETVNSELIDIKREEFLFDFLKIKPCKCEDWLHLKKSFFATVKEAIAEFQSNVPAVIHNRINSIVKPNDCSDMESVLKKLRIIRTENRIQGECNLTVDFDVYNRDVQNFRKTKRPTPHFRVICFNEKKNIPSGEEIADLHSKYTDNVVIVFAIVGVDSISYLQINPTDLPVYISNNT